MSVHVIGTSEETIGFALAGVSVHTCVTAEDVRRAVMASRVHVPKYAVVAIARGAAALCPELAAAAVTSYAEVLLP